MRKKILFFLLIILLVKPFGFKCYSQDISARILFLLDASGSMWGMWEKEQKIVLAKRILTHLVDSLGDIPNIELGLRVYGHSSPKARQDCKDTRLEVPFGIGNKTKIIEKLKGIVPKGTTPISYSLAMAANDFPISTGVRNIVILISDGIEECQGDPCATSLALQKRGIILKPFVIGLGIDDNLIAQLDCVGNFFNATDEKSFQRILEVVVSNVLNNTTAQVNLLDSYGKVTETDVNMTFYDSKSGLIRYNFYHTMNELGNPDTLYLDPIYKYDIVVNTIPRVEKKGVELSPGKHNIIAIPTPQGSLELKVEGITGYQNLQCLVREKGKTEIINVQPFNGVQKYLTGKYELEILSLPRIKIDNTEIKQSYTTTIEIPQPGKISIFSNLTMFGSIYQMKNGMLEWVCDINQALKKQTIVMQPGTYLISYRKTIAYKTSYTNQVEFTITSGGSTNLTLK